jgi:flagellum-specific ATP synthase
LPQLVERAGTGVAGCGSITAFYTVLAEGDDEQDPIVDAARAILDGHVMLSRQMAESGIYPPVDVEPSVSRSMLRVALPEQLRAAQRFREVYSYYLRHRDLITVGAYRAGADAQLDRAVELWPRIEAFMSQDQNQPVGLAQSVSELIQLVSEPPPAPTQPIDPSAPAQGSEDAS